ncbi:MAG: phytochelatin synthase family protein [Cyanobacteriota bacterium]
MIAAISVPALSQKTLATPIPLATPEGMTLLSSSTARADYGSLAQEFLTQATLTYCGVASSVMVLNSLNVPAPEVPGYGPYRFWTQDNVWSGTDPGTVVSAGQVQRQGMTLSELATLLRSHGLVVEAIHGQELTLTTFRKQLEQNLSNPSDRLLVNYDRKSLGQNGGGHISPVAAYHATSDQVLILDVSRYRYPTVWVPVRDLWQAIRTMDTGSGKSRGMVLIRR